MGMVWAAPRTRTLLSEQSGCSHSILGGKESLEVWMQVMQGHLQGQKTGLGLFYFVMQSLHQDHAKHTVSFEECSYFEQKDQYLRE